MKLINLPEIKQILTSIDLIPLIEQGFVAYSNQEAVIPPVGELLLTDPPGDVHIKYGYLKKDDYYVVKIASGFPENHQHNLPTCNGLMLIFSQKTGEPLAVLNDECYLTNVRTAVAGAIAAKYLAPTTITAIGIVGTGVQAELQLAYLKSITDCRKVVVWGRREDGLADYQRVMSAQGFQVTPTQNIAEVTAHCNLIVTTTPSTTPLLNRADIRKGTHITAVGSDTPHKQELAADILGAADKVVADSISQCCTRGEISHALKAGCLAAATVVELGAVIAGAAKGRSSDDEITIVDLTGVAVQDIQIAKAVFAAL